MTSGLISTVKKRMGMPLFVLFVIVIIVILFIGFAKAF